MSAITRPTSPKFKKSQTLAIISIGLIWLISLGVFNISSQFKSEKNIIENKAQAITQKLQLEQKRTETLLSGLSEFYTSQTVKSIPAFREFALGLLKNSQSQHVIGLAEIISRKRQTEIETQQYNMGYESFKISNSHIFSEQTKNKDYGFLAITSIIPLTPSNSVYLSEDLFSIPQIVNGFTESVKNNKSKTLLLNRISDNKLFKMSFVPIYLNSPGQLNHAQRLKQTRGIVFILLPALTNIQEEINHFFNPQNSSYTVIKTQNNNFNMLLGNQHNKTFIDQWLNLKTQFSLPILPGISQPSINVIHSWYISQINLTKLIKTLIIGFMAYILVTLTILFFITYTQNLRQLKTRLFQLLETSQDAVIITDENGFIIDWNPEAEKLFGYTKDEAFNQNIVILIFDLDAYLPENIKVTTPEPLVEIFYSVLELSNTENKTNRTEINLLNRDNSKITSELSVSKMEVNDQIEISLFIKDITYQRQTEDAIAKMAYFDALTELENRVFFKQTVEKHIIDKPDEPIALLFMDLDGFKQVNDTLGHSVGDELLKVIAKRIQSTLRSHQTMLHICRFGGDEFVVMLSQVDEHDTSQISLRLLNQIERTIKIDNDELRVSASIGIALYPDHGHDIDTLLRHADTAMYQSKAVGKNTYSIYHHSMEQDLAERISIEKHLRTAVQNNEFTLVYQPQINLQTGVVIGVEALIRWNNPTLGFVPPDKFIPIAEESSLILSIGEWVAQQSIQQLNHWKDTRFDRLHIAINVSSVQFENPQFLGFINDLMQRSNLQNHLLEIELTERTVMNNATENIDRFNDIRANGFGLSVDDFGTGYSSLSYLKKFPLSILKIDKSFVDGIPQEEEDISIATAILNLAHSLNMQVVAEGVETLEQLTFLRDLNCDYAQGYYINRPLAITDLEHWLKNNDSHFQSDVFAEKNNVQ